MTIWMVVVSSALQRKRTLQGGSQAIVSALLRGLTRHGGQLLLRTRVEAVEADGSDRSSATALRLSSGARLRVREAVVSNASVWDTAGLLHECEQRPEFEDYRRALQMNDSMVHLHLGFARKEGALAVICRSCLLRLGR